MPGDLNLKKSWNPALVKNQTKVWKKEQETLEEFKKIKQREDELLKEQEMLKLINLKKNNTTLSTADKLKLNKLDWMYDEPATVQAPKKVESAPVVKNFVDKDPLKNLDPMSQMRRTVIDKRERERVHKPEHRQGHRDRGRDERSREHKHREPKREHRHREREDKDRDHREHRRDRHREDRHREDRHREDRHREDRHREDRHRDKDTESKLSKSAIPY